MKVMLLAAGRGERLRPLTDKVPKPLLEAGGRTLIEHLITALADAGFNDLVVNCAWQGEQLQRRLGDGSQHGVRITFSPETEALETGGGIAKALPLLGPGPFLAVNADVWTDFPFAALRREFATPLHLVMVDNPDQVQVASRLTAPEFAGRRTDVDGLQLVEE